MMITNIERLMKMKKKGKLYHDIVQMIMKMKKITINNNDNDTSNTKMTKTNKKRINFTYNRKQTIHNFLSQKRPFCMGSVRHKMG